MYCKRGDDARFTYYCLETDDPYSVDSDFCTACTLGLRSDEFE